MTSIPDTLVTSHLQMTDESRFRPALLDDSSRAGCQAIRLETVDVDYYRFLYGAVGGPWLWTDRLRESQEAEIRRDLANPEHSVDVFFADGAPAGFMEMIREGKDFEIIYFGLREMFIGRGLGKHFLSVGVQGAWNEGAERVWLHTCNLDGPHAMSNYLKRGFEVFEVEEDPMPPWLGPEGKQALPAPAELENVRVTWRHLRQ